MEVVIMESIGTVFPLIYTSPFALHSASLGLSFFVVALPFCDNGRGRGIQQIWQLFVFRRVFL